jgi:hypothetical protein
MFFLGQELFFQAFAFELKKLSVFVQELPLSFQLIDLFLLGPEQVNVFPRTGLF